MITSVPDEPSVVRGKGRPRGSLNLEKPAKNTKRDPSHFEVIIEQENREARQPAPASTAPAIMTSNSFNNAARIASISGTAAGLQVLKFVDSYEPGTVMQRAYQRSLQQLEDQEDEWVDQINLDFEDEMDQAWETAEQDALALAEERAS